MAGTVVLAVWAVAGVAGTALEAARRWGAAAGPALRAAGPALRAAGPALRAAGRRARVWWERARPRLVAATRTGHRWWREADVVADRWVTLAGVEADGWRAWTADRLAIVAVHTERVCMWASPLVSAAARRAGRALEAALGRMLRPAHLLRGITVAAALLVAPAAAVLAFGLPAVEVSLRAFEVDVRPPSPLPGLTQRSVVVDAEGTRLALLHDAENRTVVAMVDIPDHVRHAVIAAEDRRFYEHDGYDVAAMGRAMRENIEATAVVQGGSTITQQLAKQNYVGDDQSLDRKVQELFHAIGLEEAYDKDVLLWRYLNQVYFGSGAYGMAAAAEEFFRVEPADLTVSQAALLASQIRAPGAVDPRAEPEAAAARRDQVLDQMVAEGFLEPEEAEEARAQPVEVEPPLDQSPTEPYVVEAVKREFLANEAFGETREARLRALFGGGLRIETTLDPSLQSLGHEVVQRHVEALGGPTAALAAVEPGTGRILAIAGGGDFEERRFDLATQSRRQPGSALKTFAFVAALEAGIDPRTDFDGNSPAEHDLPHDQEWTVHNFGGQSHGRVDLRQALVSSINTAFAEVALQVGHDEIIDVAQRLGIPEAAFGDPSTHGPSVALGGLTHGVSPLEMAAAYAALVDRGRYAAPFLIERVIGHDGEVRYERETAGERVVSAEVADTTLLFLQDVVLSGTGRAAQVAGWRVAGKTGTTQNSADAWFVGVVPPLSAAVWVGHPEAQTPVPGLTGGGAAAPLWREFAAGALEGVDPRDPDD